MKMNSEPLAFIRLWETEDSNYYWLSHALGQNGASLCFDFWAGSNFMGIFVGWLLFGYFAQYEARFSGKIKASGPSANPLALLLYGGEGGI